MLSHLHPTPAPSAADSPASRLHPASLGPSRPSQPVPISAGSYPAAQLPQLLIDLLTAAQNTSCAAAVSSLAGILASSRDSWERVFPANFSAATALVPSRRSLDRNVTYRRSSSSCSTYEYVSQAMNWQASVASPPCSSQVMALTCNLSCSKQKMCVCPEAAILLLCAVTRK